MANLYGPDPLNTGGKRWDVLVKNSSQDGDYSWQGLEPRWPDYQTSVWDRDFAWQAKDYALLALYDPTNQLRFNTDNRQNYKLGNGTGNGLNANQIEFNNIPQTYRSLIIRGQYFQERGTNPNWLYMRYNQYSGSANNNHFSRWASSSTTTQNLDSTSVFGIARGYQPDSYNTSHFEITIPSYSKEGQPLSHWYGMRTSEESAYAYYGYGYISGDKNDSGRNVGPINRIFFFPSDGFIHAHSWIAIYGVK